MNRRVIRSLLGASVVLAAQPGWAWHAKAHQLATRIAAAALPKQMPAFFAAGAETIAHCSQDPDLFRLRANPQLREQQVPEHFFDLELLGGAPIPPSRYVFVDWCARQGLRPSKVGFLPYAVVEWTQRLTIALAEYRRWPDDPHIRRKCLVYAGILSHYAQDLHQPLHLTIHYDGRVAVDGRGRPRGPSPRSGIHAKVDALLEKVHVVPGAFAKTLKPVRFARLLPAVVAEMKRTHGLVGRVYELEKELPAVESPLDPDSGVGGFARERLRACAEFTASLFLTAWEDSEKFPLPQWDDRRERPRAGGGPEPDERTERPKNPPTSANLSFRGTYSPAAVGTRAPGGAD